MTPTPGVTTTDNDERQPLDSFDVPDTQPADPGWPERLPGNLSWITHDPASETVMAWSWRLRRRWRALQAGDRLNDTVTSYMLGDLDGGVVAKAQQAYRDTKNEEVPF